MKPKPSIEDRVISLIPHHDAISIANLSRSLGLGERKTLSLCEDMGLNINIGMRCGNGVFRFHRIGEYTVENLSD